MLQAVQSGCERSRSTHVDAWSRPQRGAPLGINRLYGAPSALAAHVVCGVRVGARARCRDGRCGSSAC